MQFEWKGTWHPYTSLSFPRLELAIKRLREEEKKMSNEGYAMRLVMVEETVTPILLKTVTGIPIKLKSTPNNNDTPPGIAVVKEFTTARIKKATIRPTLPLKEIADFAASDNTNWALMQEVGEVGWTQD